MENRNYIYEQVSVCSVDNQLDRFFCHKLLKYLDSAKLYKFENQRTILQRDDFYTKMIFKSNQTEFHGSAFFENNNKLSYKVSLREIKDENLLGKTFRFRMANIFHLSGISNEENPIKEKDYFLLIKNFETFFLKKNINLLIFSAIDGGQERTNIEGLGKTIKTQAKSILPEVLNDLGFISFEIEPEKPNLKLPEDILFNSSLKFSKKKEVQKTSLLYLKTYRQDEQLSLPPMTELLETSQKIEK